TEVPLVSGPVAGFRLRARLAIRGRIGSPKVGLFEAGTHRVVHVPECRVHHPLINRVAQVVRGALAEARVPPYSDAAHQGLARYLQVVVERRSQRAQVVLVANSATAEPLASALALIAERLGHHLQVCGSVPNVSAAMRFSAARSSTSRAPTASWNPSAARRCIIRPVRSDRATSRSPRSSSMSCGARSRTTPA